VILINGNSASASEITAWALREYNKAILLWEKTYGKGSVQQPFELNDGSLLKLTVARWFTPQGKSIDGEGITPDIAIEFQEEDYKNLYDRQLEEAKKLLQMFIEKWSIGLTLDAFKNQNLSESGAVQK
jgi:carboxyl-terminal processing protease